MNKLKVPEDFFDRKEVLVLESLEDGYLYADIFLKLCLKSIKTDGVLYLFEDDDYYIQALAEMTRHDPDVINEALSAFVDLGLAELSPNTLTILMLKQPELYSKE